MDGKTIQGSRIKVEKSLGGRKRDRSDRRDRNSNPYRTDYRILIEGLPTSVNWQRLKDFARDGGEVSYTDVRRDGVGFVIVVLIFFCTLFFYPFQNRIAEYRTYEEMRRAVKKLDRSKIEGVTVTVREVLCFTFLSLQVLVVFLSGSLLLW